MALRVCSKINNGVPATCMRLLSNNLPQLAVFKVPEDVPPASQKEKESVSTTNLVQQSISSNQRTTPVESPSSWRNAFESELDTEQRGIENKFLQPSTMPSYCEAPVFDQKFMHSIQDPEIRKAQDISLNNSASQNILEVLKKKKNQNSYIKFIKMASSPFPDPIKAIFSPYTISDEEKARQMFDDHKMARMMSTQVDKGKYSCGHNDNKIMKASRRFHRAMSISSKITHNSKGFCGLDQALKRFYGTGMLEKLKENSRDFRFNNITSNFATDKKCEKSEVCVDKKKCPKEKSCVAKKCDKIKIKGCPAIRGDGICKERIQEVKCTKIEAPYPSFSEKCYLEPKPKLSECEVCPWSRKRNPNFKDNIKLPTRKYHTARFSNISGGNLAQNFERLSAECNLYKTQPLMQTANLSQTHNSIKKVPKMNFYDFGKLGKIVSYIFLKVDDCGRVEKDQSKCKKISPGACKGAKLRKPIDYLKEHFEKNKNKNKGDAKCQSGQAVVSNNSNFGYCERRPTEMTEFLSQNSELMTKFRNGDDLGDFGVNKAKLSELLCSPEATKMILKQGDKKGTDYPENCEKQYIDTTKKCPTGLTYKKTNKDRLKRKKPKEPESICDTK